MPAYQMVNTLAQTTLYQVAEASPEDIERANANLAKAGSVMRFCPIELATAAVDAKLDRLSIPAA